MWNRSVWLVWLTVLPLALILGYLLATPYDRTSFGVVGLVLFVLCIPVLLKWHYSILLFSWNAALVPFFLPGRPDLWMLMVFLSLTISILRRAIDKEAMFLKTPRVTYAILFLGAVIFVTALMTGAGLSVLGSKTFGGRKYILIFAAIAGYFALTAQSIPKERARFYVTMFFLSGLTSIVSNLAYMGGPAFYFLFALFPVEGAISQAAADQSITETVTRVAGLGMASMAVYCTLLARNGIREIFDVRKPWRLVFLGVAAFASLLGGFRSAFVILSLLFAVQFYFEGLHRTRLMPIFLSGIILGAVALLPFVTKLPFSVQRALSVLPIEVDPFARADAEHSSEWRLQMWKIVAPQIPQYFFKGKGYTIDPTDLLMTEQLSKYGWISSNESSILAGNYHSGPLSLIIPFGIFGVIGFIWFLGASLQTLYRHYKHGDPALKRYNTFLLAYFLTKTVFFFAIYGDLSYDLFVFVGLIGLSISLNGRTPAKKSIPMRQSQPAEKPVLASV